jgi:N-formylmaleamate deformylase
MLPHWSQKDILVNDKHLNYTHTGSGDEGKSSLVLLHGFSDNGLCWLPVARDLQEEWDVILPDARAHGFSERAKPGTRIDMPADVADLIQSLRLENPVIGGHSMGANTAAQVEARFPGLARALILEDPAWHDFTPAPVEGEQEKKTSHDLFVEWLVTLKGTPLDAVKAKGRADNPTWPEIEMDPWAESKLQFDPAILQTEGTWMDWQEVAKAIHCPALLITADPEKGAIITPENARLATRLSNCIKVVHITGAGHNIRRENYDAYMKAVKGFLRSISPG